MGLSGRLRKAVWTWLFGQLVLDDFELTDTTKTMSTVDTGLGRTLGSSSRVVLRLGRKGRPLFTQQEDFFSAQTVLDALLNSQTLSN